MESAHAPGASAPPGTAYDEAYDESGSPRPHYAELLGALEDPAALAEELARRARARGIGFPLDPVPRLLTGAEWSELQAGIGQRLRALEAFVADVYGPGRVFDAGVLAREDVERSAQFEPAMRGATPARWITYAGIDVVRCADGRFRVLEDQVRMPSGVAYAVALRETLRELLPRRRRSRTPRSRLASSRSRCATRPRRVWTSRAWWCSPRGRRHRPSGSTSGWRASSALRL